MKGLTYSKEDRISLAMGAFNGMERRPRVNELIERAISNGTCG
jgi:hypothetical protein